MYDTRFPYEYRFVAACGLERKVRGSEATGGFGLQQALNGQSWAPPKIWHTVEGKDFLSMTWEELEHVAHVIRDASNPTNEAMESVTRHMHSEAKAILADRLTTLDGKPLKPLTPEAVKIAYEAACLGDVTDYPHAIFWNLAKSGYAPSPRKGSPKSVKPKAEGEAA